MLILEKAEELTEDLKKYILTNLELAKLNATERSSVIGAGLISNLIITLVATFFILFMSIGAAFFLSSEIGNTYAGFIVIGLFYFIVCLILLISKKNLIEKPIRNKIIQNILNNN